MQREPRLSLRTRQTASNLLTAQGVGRLCKLAGKPVVLRLWKVTVLFSNYGNLLSTHFSRAHFLDGELISPIENSLAIQKLRHLVRLVSQGK